MNLNEKYKYGQRVFNRGKMIGKPTVAYIVSRDPENETIVKLSETFPYTPGKDAHFFIHVVNLIKHFRHEKEGVQMKIF